jgi:isopenicillin N synthase-like dioxygenase
VQLKCPFPIIDCGPLYDEPRSAAAHRVIDAICDSGRRYGFLLLANTNVNWRKVETAFRSWRQFLQQITASPEFAQDLARNPDTNLGLTGNGDMVFDPTRPGDCNISMRIHNEPSHFGDAWTPAPKGAAWAGYYNGKNKVPLWMPELEIHMLAALAEAGALFGRTVLKAYETGLSLKLPEAAYDPKHSLVRALAYRASSVALSPGQRWTSPHTDFGFGSVVFQDGVAGLRAKIGSVWVPIPAPQRVAVVNNADLMAKFYGGLLPSIEHDVDELAPAVDRLSIACFEYYNWTASLPDGEVFGDHIWKRLRTTTNRGQDATAPELDVPGSLAGWPYVLATRSMAAASK